MENKILAKIGDTQITTNDIDRVIVSFPEEQRAQLDNPDGRERILNQKIANCVMALAMKKKGGALTPEQESMKADFEEQLLSQGEINEAFASVSVTDDEIRKFYEEGKENFKTEEQINARHILMESLEEIRKIREQILAGEISFEDAAIAHSTCPSAPQGGELGFFGRGMMVPEFDEAAFAAELNQVTEPVQTQFGYHLIKVIDKKLASIAPFEEVTDQIRAQLTQQKQNDVLVTRIEVLKGKYDDIQVDESAVDRLIDQYPAQHQSYLQTEEGRNAVREQKLAYMVLTRSAREKGKDQEADFFASVRDYEEQMLAQQMIQELFDSIEISDEEAKKYYDVAVSQFRTPEQVHARHILVDSREKADEIREKILSGEISFEDAAKEHSTCPSKADGGSLGYFGHGQMVQEFDEAAFAAEIGQVTEPVQTQFGYHLIKVEDKKEAGEQPFEEVKNQIIQQMAEQRKNEVYFAKVQELKDVYGVEIF
ncbi:MAG: peptidylprolyl isomerase [Lachnospiraceae bacterium]|nr:peptidylprolyl isomerase [Lachnospiraceae bacterium]